MLFLFVFRLKFAKVAPVNGAPGAISVANGWSLQASGSNIVFTTARAAGEQICISGASVMIPPSTTYGFFLGSPGAVNFLYRNGVSSVQTYTTPGTGIEVITSGSAGYGGSFGSPTFNPRELFSTLTFAAFLGTE